VIACVKAYLPISMDYYAARPSNLTPEKRFFPKSLLKKGFKGYPKPCHRLEVALEQPLDGKPGPSEGVSKARRGRRWQHEPCDARDCLAEIV